MLEPLMCFRAFFKGKNWYRLRVSAARGDKVQRTEKISFAAHERSE